MSSAVLQSNTDIESLPWKGMPTTRFQGSKRKLLPALFEVFKGLEFSTALDGFGGTGSVSHLLRSMGKRVFFRDSMLFTCECARALFGADGMPTGNFPLESVFLKQTGVEYSQHIESLFKGIYFTDPENRQLDIVVGNIRSCPDDALRSELWYVLFQSMLSKRPYNLFHRANLEMRTRTVDRSFGNKKTWDTSFLTHMQKFYRELTRYKQTMSGLPHLNVQNGDVFQEEQSYDLVYLDPPYAKGMGVTRETNYYSFYHFLDALLRYDSIPERVLLEYKHKPFYAPSKRWHSYESTLAAFEVMFRHFKNSILVFSYRDDGYPSEKQITASLGRYFGAVEKISLGSYQYALSSRKCSREVVWVAHP